MIAHADSILPGCKRYSQASEFFRPIALVLLFGQCISNPCLRLGFLFKYSRDTNLAAYRMSTDWENRYQTGDMPWEKGEASPGLVDFLAAHPNLARGPVRAPIRSSSPARRSLGTGAFSSSTSVSASRRARTRTTVCIPGCGTGHDVRAWAKAGFVAFGYDIAPSAVRLSRQRTGAAGLSAKFDRRDFLRDKAPQRFDWIFEHTLFCAIEPGERDQYVRAVLRWLKPAGNYLAVNYLIPDTEGPPFGTTREELVERFSPHFELREEWVPRSYPNRTGLERMMWWRGKERGARRSS